MKQKYFQPTSDKISGEFSGPGHDDILQTILQTVPSGIGMTVNRIIQWANHHVADITGYSSDELAGMNARMLYENDEEYERVGRVKYDQIKHKGSGSVKTVWKKKNGNSVSVYLHSAPIEPADLSRGVLFTALDLTKQETTARTLRDLDQKHRLILNSIGEGIFGLDSAGKTSFVNAAALDALGYESPENLLQKDFHSVCHHSKENSSSYPIPECPVHKSLQDGKHRYGEDEIFWKNDGTPISVSYIVNPVYEGSDIQGVVVSFKDITGIKQLERQLLQAQKMESIGTLAGGVAHDFNNLLTIIFGNLDLVLEDCADKSIHKNLIEIQKASERAASLVRQLLLFSRKEPMHKIAIDLNMLVLDLLKMLNRVIGEDITVNTECAPELNTILADYGTVEQVIMNLAVNARDAMPEGGTLTLKTENVSIDSEYVKQISFARPGNFVQLSISDTGSGMDQKTMNRIFEPFFSTKEADKGTGLGLAVVYGIIKEHDGWVNVYSEPGHGATFKVYLPVTDEKGGEISSSQIDALDSLHGNGERILFVEDNATILKITKEMLTSNGYEVLTAASAEEAMEIAEEEEWKFDLIFSDVVLPGQTGLEMVEQLHPIQKQSLKIILCSGYTDEKSLWSKIRERGYRFISKPFHINELLKTIKEVLTS